MLTYFRRIALWGALVLCVIIAAGAWWRFLGPGRQPYYGATQLIGQAGPRLEVEEWLSPPPDLTGKFVVIDFWATWCVSCRHSIPYLNALQKAFAPRVQFIGLTDESAAKVNAMEGTKIAYASAIDTRGRTKRAVGVMVLPYLMVIDPKGKVRYEGVPVPGNEFNDEVLSKIIADYDAGR